MKNILVTTSEKLTQGLNMMLLSDGEYVVNDSEVVQAYVVIKMVWEIILLAYFLPNSYFFKLSIV